MKRKNLKKSGICLAGIIVIVSLAYAIDIQPLVIGRPNWYKTTNELTTFGSYVELEEFLEKNYYNFSGRHHWLYQAEDSISFSMSKSGSLRNNIVVPQAISDVDYSKTNVQVEGVDEPDVVKTDGEFLYVLANSKIYIIKVYPSDEAKILSKVSLDDFSISNFFINKNHLIVFASSTRYPIGFEENDDNNYYWNGCPTTIIKIYDVSDKENPENENDIEVDGYYFDARMIGNYVYIIATEYSGDVYCILEGNVTLNIPEIKINGCTEKIPADCIYYINTSEEVDTFTNIISINIFSGEVNQKSFLLGGSQNMYVSLDNIYLTNIEYNYIERSSIFSRPYQTYLTKTVVNKISITDGEISHTAQGSVPGTILNQFSMDEHNGFFRVATTIGEVWNTEQKSTNNIYILNKDLEQISEIEGIAPGEKIYSARFIGSRAYLVTFKKIDPFFTIDLSDPYNPEILGELKIPGYSDYLHPYDENHIIGLGKDTVEPQEEYSWTKNFAWYQGIKIALFDVSDFENPKVISQVIIGDRGSDSSALHNHKAFLFDREKQLLVLPVRVCEINDEIKEQNKGYTGSMYGSFKFQGTYVYKLSLEDGFELKGKITHLTDDSEDDEFYWYRCSSPSYITRSLYINDVLYTVSNSMVKMNDLHDIGELNNISLL